MRAPLIVCVLAASMFAACGSSHVDTAKYTCGEFNKSLRTKGDDSSGTFIRDLRTEANLGQDAKTEQREITIGIIVACRGKAGNKTPGDEAITTAKKIK